MDELRQHADLRGRVHRAGPVPDHHGQLRALPQLHARQERVSDHDHHHHHHADEVFTSWGKETPRKYTKEEVETILKALSADNNEYGIILRAKGMLPSQDGTWIYFDMVPEEYEIREGQPEYTGRLCVIGSKIDEAKLEKLFML